jgi:hypothetical protein
VESDAGAQPGAARGHPAGGSEVKRITKLMHTLSLDLCL